MMSYDEQEELVVDTAFCERISAQLKTAGYEPVITTGGSVRFEVKVCGEVWSVGHVMPASRCFTVKEEWTPANTQRRQRSIFMDMQDACAYDDWNSTPRPPLYVYLVGEASLIGKGEFAMLRWELERDTSIARKFICSFEDLSKTMRNPFNPVAYRANVAPKLYCFADREEKEQPNYDEMVTKPFNERDFSCMLETLAQRENAPRIRQQVVTLFRRILGADYALYGEGDEWPAVGRVGDTEGVPHSWASSGEQTTLALSLYLALLHDSVPENLCIGIRASLNRLDLLAQINALDCIAQFVLATGSSVYFKTDNQQNLRNAENRLTPAVRLATKIGEMTV